MNSPELPGLPDELRPHDDQPVGPRRGTGTRVAVIIVALAMILLLAGVWIVQAGLIFPL